MAARAEIAASAEWHTGTDHVFEVVVYQADGTTRQNLAGWSLSWLLKQGHAQPDAAALVAKSTEGSPADGITVTNAAQGELEILVEAVDTRDIDGGRYVHELKRVDTAEESVLMYGPAVLKRALHLSAP